MIYTEPRSIKNQGANIRILSVIVMMHVIPHVIHSDGNPLTGTPNAVGMKKS